MFDNFVVDVNKDKKTVADELPASMQDVEEDIDLDIAIDNTSSDNDVETDSFVSSEPEEISSTILEDNPVLSENPETDVAIPQDEPDLSDDTFATTDDQTLVDEENTSLNTDLDSEPETPADNTPDIVTEAEQTYTIEELQNAVNLAKEEAYKKAQEDALNSITGKQNLLLDDIKNQLVGIYASMDQKKEELEESSVRFAVELVGKILPSLEKERAEEEVRRFLVANFANFAAQETLSFTFNPETVNVVADCIGRLAEQNDFEGKISVHKDSLLAPADCRVEWKSGGVEHSTSKIMDKVKSLIDNNSIKERENG